MRDYLIRHSFPMLHNNRSNNSGSSSSGGGSRKYALIDPARHHGDRKLLSSHHIVLCFIAFRAQVTGCYRAAIHLGTSGWRRRIAPLGIPSRARPFLD